MSDILHLVNSAVHGGGEQAAVELVAAQRRAGGDVTVLSASPAFGAPDFPVITTRVGLLRFAWRHRRAIARARTIHVHKQSMAEWLAWACRLHTGAPILLHVQNPLDTPAHPALAPRLVRMLDRGGVHVVAVSSEIRRQWIALGLDARRVHLVVNWGVVPEGAGADAPERFAPAGDHVAVGVVAHFYGAQKRQDTVVRALARPECAATRVHFVGDGPSRGRVEALAAECGVADRCTFHGAVDHGAVPWDRFDVLLSVSDFEGSPKVVAEAAGRGIPVVANPLPGIRDQLGDLLVPCEPTPEGVAAALASLPGAAPSPRALVERHRRCLSLEAQARRVAHAARLALPCPAGARRACVVAPFLPWAGAPLP